MPYITDNSDTLSETKDIFLMAFNGSPPTHMATVFRLYRHVKCKWEQRNKQTRKK